MRTPDYVQTVIVIVSAIIVLSFFAAAWTINDTRVKSARHTIFYDITISSEANLENLTLLLPVPLVNGSPAPGEDFVQDLSKKIPEGWRLSLVNVNSTPMLKIEAPRLVGNCSRYPVPITEGDSQSLALSGSLPVTAAQAIRPIPLETREIVNTWNPVMIIHPEGTTVFRNGTGCSPDTPVLLPIMLATRVNVDKTIDTRDPVGREPLLFTGRSAQPGACRSPITGSSRCSNYQSPVYIDYAGNKTWYISVSTSVSGFNEWWEVFGWTTNSYTDRISVLLKPGEKGRVMANGMVQTGNGRY